MDKFILWILTWLVIIVICMTIWFALFTPSCEERGGRDVFSHLLPVFTGKTVVMVPQYTCELPEEKTMSVYEYTITKVLRPGARVEREPTYDVEMAKIYPEYANLYKYWAEELPVVYYPGDAKPHRAMKILDPSSFLRDVNLTIKSWEYQPSRRPDWKIRAGGRARKDDGGKLVFVIRIDTDPTGSTPRE